MTYVFIKTSSQRNQVVNVGRGRFLIFPWILDYQMERRSQEDLLIEMALGLVVAVCLALSLGFTHVQWIASSLYLPAAVFMWRMTKGWVNFPDRPLPEP